MLKTIATRSIWNLIAAVAYRAFNLLIGVVIARWYGQEAFGRYGLVISAIAMFATAAAQACSTATAKHIGENLLAAPHQVGSGIGWSLGFACSINLAIVIGLNWSGGESFHSLFGVPYAPEVSVPITTVAAMIVITGWASGVLSGFGLFRRLSYANSAALVVGLPLTVALIKLAGVEGALWGLACFNCINATFCCAAALSTLRRNGATNLRPKYTDARQILKVGLPVLATGLMVAPSSWFANKLIAGTPHGFSELGVYMAAFQWNSLFSQVSVVLGGVLIPLLANDLNADRRGLDRANMLVGWLVVVITAEVLLIFPELLSIIYGSRYSSPSFHQSLILCVTAAVVVSYKGGLSRKIVSMDLAWFSVPSNMLWSGLFISLVYSLREYGAVGVAGALLASQVAHLLLTVPFFLKKKIVPVDTVLAWPVLTVWLTVFCAAMVGLFGRELLDKACMLAVTGVVNTLCFRALLKKPMAKILVNRTC